MIDVCAAILEETSIEVGPETPLDDIDLDSLEFLNLVLYLSEKAGKEIPDGQIAQMKTVGDLMRELA